MDIKVFHTGPLDVNTYLLMDEESKEAALIDVGGSFETIKREIDSKGYTLKFILNTHGHFDHIIGEIEIQKNHSDIPIYMHEDDYSHFNTNLEKEINMWGFGYRVDPLNPTKYIDESTELYLGKQRIKILHTPGHSKGSLSYFVDGKLFSGDALFQRSIGRTDFYDGDFDTLIDSIQTKMFTLDDNTIVYPGHGPTTTIREEKKYNTYLNC